MPTGGLSGRLFLKVIARQRVSVTTADLIGPPVPLYFAGMRVTEVFPVLPLVGRTSLGVGALSYAGALGLAVVGDREAYPDLSVFGDGLAEELRRLGRVATPASPT
jgi:hypothetical protein